MRTWTCAAVLAIALGPAELFGDPVVLFTNLGPGRTYDSSTYFVLEDDETQEYTFGFTPTVSGQLGQVSLPVEILWWQEHRSDGLELFFEVRSSDAGAPDGVFESWRFVESDIASHPAGAFLTLTSSTGLPLVAGQEYFFGGRLLSSRQLRWFKAPLGDSGPVYERIGSPQFFSLRPQAQGAFEVTGVADPVPEPATLLLVGGGLAAGLRARRRRSASTS